MALLERDSSLAALQAYLRDAASGEGRLVMVAGEAGVGKSVLIEQLQRRTPDAGWALGACDGLSTPGPLAPLFDLAESLGGHLLELCQGPSDRDQLFRALLQQLINAQQPQVVVVEDIHWADEATLDMLRFLGRRLRAVPVLLILTYRNDSPNTVSAVGAALGELGTLRWTRRLALAPLSRAAVGRLAVDTELDADDLFHLTGGNPFYVTELIAAGVRGVTASARDAVMARAADLTPTAQALLESASLIGGRIEPSLLIAASGCTSADLDELVDAGLLVEDNRALRFRHEIARMAVEQRIPAHRRPDIHARVLAGLLTNGELDDSRLAFHADEAGDGPVALHYAVRAARRAAELGAHREAAAQFQRALRFRGTASTRLQAELYGGLADESMLADACQIASDANEKALRLWRTLGDRQQEGNALRRYANALLNLCRGDEALVAAQESITVLRPLGVSMDLAAALSTLATFAMVRNEMASAVELARQAEEVARSVGATEVIADALNIRGVARSATDPAWTELVRRALELALSHNLQGSAARAYSNLYGMLADQYRYAEADHYYSDGVAYCEEHDLNGYLYCLRAARTMVLLNQGHWNDVLRITEPLLDERSTAPMNQICLYNRVGLVQIRRQDPQGWNILDRATALALPSGQPQYIVPLRLARAEARWLEGMAAEARAEAELAMDGVEDPDPWMRGAIDSWLRRTGSPRRPDGPTAGPYALQRLGRFAEAATLWEALGCPYDAAMALLEAGDEDSMRAALRTFDELGAKATASFTRRLMRSQGVRSIPAGPRAATSQHPLGLTPRERQVLALLAERRTNAEIGQELFISPKTVDHHVSAVLAKLNVNSREQAAAFAGRVDLDEQAARPRLPEHSS